LKHIITEIKNIQFEDYSLYFTGIEHNTKILICNISGYIDARNSDQILQEVLEIVSGGYIKIIFNLEDTLYISSTGISVFESLKKKVKPQNGNIILINIQSRVMEILKMYDYEDTFIIEHNLHSAIDYSDINLEESADKSFPKYIRCPVCASSLKISKSIRFRCNNCSSQIVIDKNGEIVIENNRNSKKNIFEHTNKNYKVLIYGENELVDSLESGNFHYSHCISIGNPNQEIPEAIKKGFDKILRLEFYDVDSIDVLSEDQEPRIPEQQDAVKVIDFFNSTKDKATGYAVHCWQGVSRSTAVGLGLLFMLGNKEDRLFDIILEIRPEANPHKMLVKFFDNKLGSNLSLIAEKLKEIKVLKMRKELEEIAKGKY